MEELETVGPEQPTHEPEQQESTQKLSIVLAVVLAAVIILGVAAFARLLGEVSRLNAAVQEAEASVSAMSEQVEQIQSIRNQVERISTLTYFNIMQHDIEGGIVTDDFVVGKATLYESDGMLKAIIDLEIQPTMYGVYTGKGEFNLSDRELRAKSLAVINKVKEYYSESKTLLMPSWEKAEISMTIQNYPIGTYANGEMTLVGEK